MWNELFMAMKQELMVTIIIFILLFIKISDARQRNEGILILVNLLLLVNLVAGFLIHTEADLFNGMFRTNKLIIVEKNILNLRTLLFSMQAHPWLKDHMQAHQLY